MGNAVQVPTVSEIRESGYVRARVPQASFGFIELDSGEQLFFHRRNIRGSNDGTELPAVGALVTFRRFPVNIEGKKDRAIDVQIVE